MKKILVIILFLTFCQMFQAQEAVSKKDDNISLYCGTRVSPVFNPTCLINYALVALSLYLVKLSWTRCNWNKTKELPFSTRLLLLLSYFNVLLGILGFILESSYGDRVVLDPSLTISEYGCGLYMAKIPLVIGICTAMWFFLLYIVSILKFEYTKKRNKNEGKP